MFLGEEKELDLYVSIAVLGFQSIDGVIANSQFIYRSGEPKPNFLRGSSEDIYLYLLEHFCSPCGIILDVSNDSKVTYNHSNGQIVFMLYFRNNVTGSIGKWKRCNWNSRG